MYMIYIYTKFFKPNTKCIKDEAHKVYYIIYIYIIYTLLTIHLTVFNRFSVYKGGGTQRSLGGRGVRNN